MAPYTQLSVWLKYIAASFLVAKTIQFLFQFWPSCTHVFSLESTQYHPCCILSNISLGYICINNSPPMVNGLLKFRISYRVSKLHDSEDVILICIVPMSCPERPKTFSNSIMLSNSFISININFHLLSIMFGG